MSLEVSMRDLFPRCIAILEQARVPLHFEDLTRQALQGCQGDARLPLPTPFLRKNAENVREKLLKDRTHGAFYTTGKLGALGALQQWFLHPQLRLFHDDVVRIAGHAQAGADGAFEALMRAPHMQQKSAWVHTERLNHTRGTGLVLEHHVARWFAQHYADIYLPPLNQGRWEQPCAHDFRLRLGEKVLHVDVAGCHLDGSYQRAPQKSQTDVHLLCCIDGPDCLMKGVVRGKDFTGTMIPETVRSPIQFIVWLNCLHQGLDYKAIAEMAQQEPRA